MSKEAQLLTTSIEKAIKRAHEALAELINHSPQSAEEADDPTWLEEHGQLRLSRAGYEGSANAPAISRTFATMPSSSVV
jgi:hypothetical protein